MILPQPVQKGWSYIIIQWLGQMNTFLCWFNLVFCVQKMVWINPIPKEKLKDYIRWKNLPDPVASAPLEAWWTVVEYDNFKLVRTHAFFVCVRPQTQHCLSPTFYLLFACRLLSQNMYLRIFMFSAMSSLFWLSAVTCVKSWLCTTCIHVCLPYHLGFARFVVILICPQRMSSES